MTFILIEYAAFWGNRKEGKRGVSSKLATAQDLLQPFSGREDGCAILAFGLSHCVTSLGGYQHGETSAYLDVGGTNAGIAEPSAERSHVWKASSDASDVDDIANHKPQDSSAHLSPSRKTAAYSHRPCHNWRLGREPRECLYPPAEPGALLLLAPQRGRVATESESDLQHERHCKATRRQGFPRQETFPASHRAAEEITGACPQTASPILKWLWKALLLTAPPLHILPTNLTSRMTAVH